MFSFKESSLSKVERTVPPRLAAAGQRSAIANGVIAAETMALAQLFVGVLGGIILAHAAYLTILYRAALAIKEEEFVRPPTQALAEIAVSLALCLWAALAVPGKFLRILPDSDYNRIVDFPANLDFMVFNHRGKLFPPALEAKF